MVITYRENYEYCIFTPKPELVEFVGERSSRVILCTPIIWSTAKPGTGYAWTPEETANSHKLLFLAHLITIVQKAIPPTQQLVQELLGDPPYSAETFDRWWLLTTTFRGQSWEAVLNTISTDSINKLLPASSDAIDHFLRTLMTRLDQEKP